MRLSQSKPPPPKAQSGLKSVPGPVSLPTSAAPPPPPLPPPGMHESAVMISAAFTPPQPHLVWSIWPE